MCFGVLAVPLTFIQIKNEFIFIALLFYFTVLLVSQQKCAINPSLQKAHYFINAHWSIPLTLTLITHFFTKNMQHQ